jgi:hypothetical protein
LNIRIFRTWKTIYEGHLWRYRKEFRANSACPTICENGYTGW